MTTETTTPPYLPAYWGAAGGDAWVRLDPLLSSLYQPIGEVLVERAYPGERARVLDVGCGGGSTTRAMASRLGPEGHCVGLDISAPLLELAQRRALEESVTNAEFVRGDGQTYAAPEPFDAIMSRFGVMFFDDFDAAFTRLRSNARPGGRLAFASWRSPADNPLTTEPMRAAAPYLPPQPPTDPDAPGRFALADPNRIRTVLGRSGWTDIAVEPLDAPTPIGLEDLIRISVQLGPIGAAMPHLDEAVRSAVVEAVAERLGRHAVDGIVPMISACWLVTARA
jgi:SAM-dependent methyltransferase